VVFEKVAVTVGQVVEMKLPCRPESVEEVEKVRRDPRYKSYVARLLELAGTSPELSKLVELYGSPEMRVELDALVALRPEDFKRILRTSIERSTSTRRSTKGSRGRGSRS